MVDNQNPSSNAENANIPFYQPGIPAPVAGGPTPSAPGQAANPVQTSIGIHFDGAQVVEKIVYKKQRMYGFFRILTMIALLAVGVLMLLESTGILKLSVNNLNLDVIYPVFIILSTIVIRSWRGWFGRIFWLILFLWIVGGLFVINIYTSLNPSSKSKIWDVVTYAQPAWESTWILVSQININTLIGNIDIQGSASSNLAGWTYKSDRNLLVSSGIESNYDYLNLQEDPNRNVLQNYATDLSLGISDKKLVNLYLKNMFWVHNIDLSDVQRYHTQIYGWVQDLKVTLWENIIKDSELEVQLAGWNIVIYVPKDIWVKLYFKQLAWSLELTNFDIKPANTFESKNIATAQKTVKISISSGITKFKILWK